MRLRLEAMGVSEPPVNPWSLTERVKVTSAADEMEYQVSAERNRRLLFLFMAGSNRGPWGVVQSLIAAEQI